LCTPYTVSKGQELGFNSNMTNVLLYLYPTKPWCNKALQQREGKKTVCQVALLTKNQIKKNQLPNSVA
jgi:hypothetical protein